MGFGFFPIAGAAAILATAIFAAQEQDGDASIRLEQAWSRATPPRAMAAAAYLSITNNSGKADRLISAKAEPATEVEIHEVRMDDGIMRMRPLAGGLVIEPGETVTFQPGGLHLMLTGLHSPLRQGETLRLVLRFETAGEISTDVPVLAIGAKGPGHTSLAGEPLPARVSSAIAAV